MMSGRVCSMCDESKPAECFSLNAGRLRSRCKPCRAAIQTARYRANPEPAREYFRKRALSTKPQKAQYDRQYRARNSERIRARVKAAYHRNKAAGLNPRPLTDIEKEAVRARALRWYAANSERAKARVSTYRRSNREKNRAWQQAYRAKRKSGDGVTAAQWIAILDLYRWQCLACGETESITMDHIVPLSRGGRHEPSNIQPLCKSCNSRKHARTIDYRPDLLLEAG